MKSIRLVLAATMLAVCSIGVHAASLVYNSFLDDAFAGAIVKTDTFKCMLVTSAYTENRDTHTKRSDVTGEVTGTGYTAGGRTVTPTWTKDTTNDRFTIVFPGATYSASTITARKEVCYKSRGGASTADELVVVNDFGSDIVSSSGNFTVNAITIHFNTP